MLCMWNPFKWLQHPFKIVKKFIAKQLSQTLRSFCVDMFVQTVFIQQHNVTFFRTKNVETMLDQSLNQLKFG